jgi:CRP-like cAMP-binding protein
MALDDTMTQLRSVPLLGLLDVDGLRLLAFSGEPKRFAAGATLFRAGDRSDGGYVVLEGRIAVRGPKAGAEPDQRLGPGSLVGQVALFIRTQRTATAVAEEDTEVLRISPTLMGRVLEEYPVAALRIRDALASDVAHFAEGLERVRAMLAGNDKR